MRRRTLLFPFAAAALLGTVLVTAAEEKKPGPLPGKYAGEATCKKCHFKQSKQWKTTKHAQAHEVLPAKYKDDATCVACHTTGAGQPGGFVNTATTAAMGGVQCEMCHGPSAEHAEFAKANEAKKEDPAIVAELKKKVQPAGGEACIRCHLAQAHGKHPDYEK